MVQMSGSEWLSITTPANFDNGVYLDIERTATCKIPGSSDRLLLTNCFWPQIFHLRLSINLFDYLIELACLHLAKINKPTSKSTAVQGCNFCVVLVSLWQLPATLCQLSWLLPVSRNFGDLAATSPQRLNCRQGITLYCFQMRRRIKTRLSSATCCRNAEEECGTLKCPPYFRSPTLTSFKKVDDGHA